jgi:TolA-binding protein
VPSCNLPRVSLISTALMFQACAGEKSAYQRHVDAAHEAYEQGDYASAAAHWDDAEGAAGNASERDEASYREAVTLIRAGRPDEGRALLEKLARGGTSSRNARAAFDLAFAEIKHGDAEKGRAQLRAALVRYPDHGVARDALRRFRSYTLEKQGSERTEQELERLSREVSGSELESTALFERAKLLQERGADVAALAAYLEVARKFPYPGGTYWNDATLAAAQLERKAGENSKARALLVEMLEHREDSAVVGSYARSYDQATFALGELEAEDGLWRRARDRFLSLVDDYETSRLRDDALWAAAVLSAKKGDAATACQLARRLESELPESRFTNCQTLVCPRNDTPLGSSRDDCSGYVERAFANGALRPDPTF